MTDTTCLTSANQAARLGRRAPRIASIAVAFTPHRYNQDDVAHEPTESRVSIMRKTPKSSLLSTIAYKSDIAVSAP
jgi:hypothetical protein